MNESLGKNKESNESRHGLPKINERASLATGPTKSYQNVRSASQEAPTEGSCVCGDVGDANVCDDRKQEA